jgi:hypothetical protein
MPHLRNAPAIGLLAAGGYDTLGHAGNLAREVPSRPDSERKAPRAAAGGAKFHVDSTAAGEAFHYCHLDNAPSLRRLLPTVKLKKPRGGTAA